MPIRVLMFGWELPPYNSGGLGTACYGLTEALAGQAVDITFVLPHKLDLKVDFMRLVFADIKGFPSAGFSAYATLKHLPGHLPAGMAHDLLSAVNQYAERAAEIARQYDYDLIHAHDWLCFPAGVVAKNGSHKPLVSHVHATEYDRGGGNGINPLVYAVEKYGLERSDAVIAVSRFTKNLLAKHYLSDRQEIDVVHNGINSAEYQVEVDDQNPLDALKKASYKIVLFLGRLTLQKGPDYFLAAAKKTLAHFPRAVFLIVGSGDMEHQMVTEAVEAGISDKVLFAGFLRGRMLHQAFHAADLFVMPSVSEPFGITALEAVASGTPAIISKQSGVSETLGHVLKADFWDVDEMANQIISVLNYPSLHATLQENGQKEVKNVSWQAAASKTINIYKKVLQQS